MKAQMDAAELRKLINAARKFISQGSSKPIHEYALISFSAATGIARITAVDGYRAIEASAGCSCDEDFTVFVKEAPPAAKKGAVATITLEGRMALVNIDGRITGNIQTEGDAFDMEKALEEAQGADKVFSIAVNPKYLAEAMRAFSMTNAAKPRNHAVLEFRGKHSPIVIRPCGASRDRIIVLPVRTSGKDEL